MLFATLVEAGTPFLSLPVVGAASSEGTHSLSIPSSVKAEHGKLHGRLAGLLKPDGRTGVAAATVAALLHPHFVKEEEFAMPPLGLLSSLAAGNLPPDAEDVIRMTDRLQAAMPDMLHEHKEIVSALENLRSVAEEEGRADAVAFAEDLIAHAMQEEQILYPGAIMVGEYLKLKLKR